MIYPVAAAFTDSRQRCPSN